MSEIIDLYDEPLNERNLKRLYEFNCSDEIDVEIFLKKDAYELQEYHMAITRLFFDMDNHLVGYFTLFNNIVPKINKDKRLKEGWDLPSEKLYPSIQLHYLGVDERFRKQGIGFTLLMSAIDECSKISQSSGCTFVSVQALNSAVPFYIKNDFRKIGSEITYLNMVRKLKDIPNE